MNRSYRWVIVAAGGLLGCVAIGAMFSLPVFLRPMAQETGWSVTGISTAMTIGFLAMAAASMVWGSLSDRFGPRPIVLTGSVVLATSRHLEHEADRFSLELTRMNRSTALAFTKLQQENLSNPRPGWFYRLWRSTHPSIAERIEFSNTYHPWRDGRPLVYGRQLQE